MSGAPLLALAPSWDDGNNRPKIVPPFSRELHWDVADDGTTAVVDDTVFRLAVRSPRQPWHLITVSGLPQHPIPASALDRAVSLSFATALPPEAQRRYLETAAEARGHAPSNYPAILDVVAADSGGFWVGEAPDTSLDGRRRWTRFDPAGNAVAYALLASSDRMCAESGGVVLIGEGEGKLLRPLGWFRWARPSSSTTSQRAAADAAATVPSTPRQTLSSHPGSTDAE